MNGAFSPWRGTGKCNDYSLFSFFFKCCLYSPLIALIDDEAEPVIDRLMGPAADGSMAGHRISSPLNRTNEIIFEIPNVW